MQRGRAQVAVRWTRQQFDVELPQADEDSAHLRDSVHAQPVATAVGGDAVRELGEKLLIAGPEKLTPAERMAVMADQGVMVWLHQQAWFRPEVKLAPWWKTMIREFSRQYN